MILPKQTTRNLNASPTSFKRLVAKSGLTAALLLFSSCFQAPIVETINPPTVISSTPQSGATGVFLNSGVTVVFSEAMSSGAVTLAPRLELGAGNWDAARKTLTYAKPSKFVAATRYTMTISGTGVTGGSLSAVTPLTFTTAPTTVASPPAPVTPAPPIKPPATPPAPPSVTPPTPPPATPPAPPPTTPPAPPISGVKLPPIGKVIWDWQIGAGSVANITVPTGVTLIDIDGFDATAAKVAELKQRGIYTVCYINAGSYQPGQPDSSQYPSYLKIQADPDWAGEYFLDVTDVFKPNSVLAALLNARFKMCKDKGFDALEPDNLQNDENVSGGRITKQQQIDFNGWVADSAHRYGLAVFQKNGPDNVLLKDRTGKMMVEKFDGILNEQCQEFNECAALAEYPKRGKLALNVEYNSGITLDCTLSNKLLINSIKKDLGLAGGTMSGYKLEFCK